MKLPPLFPSGESVTVFRDPNRQAQPLSRQNSLRLLCWNLQYAASRRPHFFYDGGKAVFADEDDVLTTLASMQRILQETAPDLVFFQEVDRASDRTQRRDQLPWLWPARDLLCWAAVPYHKVRWLPFPPHRPLGQMHMDLVTFSRYAIGQTNSTPLPLLREPWWRQQFNLRRQILEVELPLQEGGGLVLMNTHLSAFSYGDGTMERQISVLLDRIEYWESKGRSWILGGDFNLLPPGFDKRTLRGEEEKYYADKDNPLRRLFDRCQPALPLTKYHQEPNRYNTYLPHGAARSDRWLDYCFLSRDLHVHRYEVLQEESELSDHLPILLDVSWHAEPGKGGTA